MRCSLVAVVGLPNAGKSTLVNALVGQKVSIVSHKVQTTRNRVMGIALKGEAQVVLMDTPGVLSAPKKRFEKAMLGAALEAPQGADLTLLVVDASRGKPEEQRALLGQLETCGSPLWVVLNQIDRLDRPQLLVWAQFFREFPQIQQTFMVSALTGDGVEDLGRSLGTSARPGPWLFPEDQVSSAPQRMLAAEITREVLFRFLHQEVPYSLYVETEAWEEFRNGSVKISQVIHVMKETQKAIVLGHQGSLIKKLSTLARQELVQELGRPAHLFLYVKVTPDWMDRARFYTLMGLTFPPQ